MKFLITVHEVLEYEVVVEAANEADAREKWEGIVVADYDSDGDTISRKIEKVKEVE